MAEDTTHAKPETPRASAKPEAAKPEAPKAATLQSRIITQGKSPNARFASAAGPDASLAGLYRITHGNMNFGHDKDPSGLAGGPVIAHTGAIVELTAEEAADALAAKTVERVS